MDPSPVIVHAMYERNQPMNVLPTLSRVILEVKRLANIWPEAVYHEPSNENAVGSCMYTTGEVTKGPRRDGCIIGQALLLAGVSDDAADMVTTEAGAYDIIPSLINEGELIQDVTVDHRGKAVDWLARVQNQQDAGNTWSVAVAKADDMFSAISNGARYE